MKKTKCISGLMFLAMLSGCAESNSQTNGVILGGIAGGLAGSAFGTGGGKAVAVGVGAVLGAMIGSNIGAKMDQDDRVMAEKAANKAAQAPIGQEIIWSNDKSGNSGSAKTIKVGVNAHGAECRQIEQQVTIEGKTDVVLVDICLIDNHWVSAS
jgi:surface antigen